MKTFIVGILIAILFVYGCGKKSSETKSDQTNQVGNPITAPVDYMGAVAKAKKYSDKTLDLVSLKRAIQEFEAGEGRFPKDLNELVTEHYLPALPKPPVGMKIEYDAKTGEVKIVPEK
ncbi:MAG: hypothetical protein ACP5MG_04980 [Verrucomicrobiia bacterium]|jgi:hypothetical protein